MQKSCLPVLNRAESKIEERRLSDAEGTYKVAQAYAVLGDNGSAAETVARKYRWRIPLPTVRRARSFTAK